MKTQLPKISQWSLNSPTKTLVLFALITLILVFGTKNLYFRGDYKVFFAPDNPQRLAFEHMHDTFNKSENVAFLIVPKASTVYNPDTLALIYDLTESAWQVPLSTRVDSLSNHQYTRADNDDLIVSNLIENPEQITNDSVSTIKAVAESTPELYGRMVSHQGEAAVVNVTVQLPDGDQTKEVVEITAFARKIVEDLEQKYPNHDISLLGMVIMNEAFVDAAQRDASTLVPGMFLLVFIMIGLLTRSVLISAATSVVVALSIAWVMGAIGYAGWFLSTATVNVPTLVTTLAVADCIHIVSAYRNNMLAGMPKLEALHKSISYNYKAILITSITTAIGFLTLNFSSVPILADLGNMTALGVMLACFFSLTLFPILLLRVSPPKPMKSDIWQTGLDRLGDLITRNIRIIIPGSIVLFILSVMMSSQNRLNDIAVNYFDSRSAFKQAVELHESYFGGMSNIDFVIKTNRSYGITEPSTLSALNEFSEWLQQQPEVHHVFTFSDTMKRLNLNMNGDDPVYSQIPSDAELASQYLLLFEMSLPFGLDINNLVDIDKSSVRMITTLENLGSHEFTGFERRAKEWFETNYPSLDIEAASPPLMFAHIGATNLESMLWGSLLALVLISGLIIASLKSLKIGAISFITNLVPAAVGFGIWALISGEINMALSVVISMTMGIIVDDTVHFLVKYQMARKAGMPVKDAMQVSLHKVGKAMTTTSIVLVCGFGVLTLSNFTLNAHMGLLSVIIIIVALLVDLIFLPAFLLWIDKYQSQTEENFQ